MQEKLTIWIPTKNRPEFLLRLFRYYSETGYRGHLFIGDSSEGENLEKNKETVKSFGSSLQIYYCEFPGLSTGHVSAKLVLQIETPFSTFLADDDIIVTSSIDSCIQYLIEHERVSGVNGKSLLFSVESGQAFGDLGGVSNYSLAEILESTGQARFAGIFSRMKNVNMCIHRTANQKVVFEKVGKLSPFQSKYIFEEAIGCAVMSIRGEVVQLPSLFLCRQAHPNMFYHSVDIFDWFTDEDWHSAFKLFEQTVIEELKTVDRISEEVAREAFKVSFWPYYAMMLSNNWDGYFKKINLKKSFQEWAKTIPGGLSVIRKVRAFRSMFTARNGEVSHPALRNLSPAHYKDFSPIYDVITKQ